MTRNRKGAALLALCSVLILSACTASNAIDTAAQIANSASSILSPQNPEAGQYLSEVGADLTFISSLVAQLSAANAVTKQTIQQQIQAKFAEISAKLPQILSLVHVKNPTLVTEISVAVAVVNSALTIIAAKMPPGSVQKPQSLSRSVGGPSVGNTAKDFKTAWNSAVKDSHPEAKI